VGAKMTRYKQEGMDQGWLREVAVQARRIMKIP